MRASSSSRNASVTLLLGFFLALAPTAPKSLVKRPALLSQERQEDAGNGQQGKKPEPEREQSRAQSRTSAEGPGPSSSAAPSPSAAEVARAIRTAKKALETAQSEAEKEAQQRAAQIAEETKSILALREEAKQLAEKLRDLEGENLALDERIGTLGESRKDLGDKLAAARTELAMQAARMKERLTGTLVAAEDEELMEALNDMRGNQSSALAEQVKVFLELYRRVLEYARKVTLVELPLRMVEGEDKIETVRVLRLGMLGAYYYRPGSRHGGFVLPEPGSANAFRATARGLTEEQQASVAAFLQRPDKGGVLPSDVSGGTAIASLQTSDTILSWFSRGGFWMWPLLGLASLSALVAAETALALVLRHLKLRRQIKRAFSLVRAGRLEAALAETANMNSPAGSVLGAVLAQREHGLPAMEAAAQEALHRASSRFQSRLGLLSLTAAASPLLGFLGTVAGIISTFKLLGIQEFKSPFSLSAGISEALITTQAGLMIAIPCLLLRGFLAAVAAKASWKLEAAALSLIVALAEAEASPLEVGEPA